MNKQRLKTLADFLKTVPTAQFDLSSWVADDDELKHDCGTTACAIGWAAEIPEFRELGFTLTKNWVDSYLPDFNGLKSWDAVEAFFSLTLKQANFLFSPNYYPDSLNPKHVIDRIELVLTQGFPAQAWNYSADEYRTF